MSIDTTKTALDFYQGKATQIKNLSNNKEANEGHIYLDTTNNNVYIGTSDKVAKAVNGVYKNGNTVVADATNFQVGATTMSEEELKSILAVSKLNLATEKY